MKKLAHWHVSHYLEGARDEHLLIAYALETGGVKTYADYYRCCMKHDPILFVSEKDFNSYVTKS